MRITDIRVVAVQAPGRTLVPIVVETDAGIAGVGEAGLQRRWRAIEGAVEHFRRWMIGEDARRIEHLWQRMHRGGFYPSDRLIGSVVAGIDIALWDIKGQALGVPVFELLGGRCRDRVEVFTVPTWGVQAGAVDPGDLLKAVENADPDATAELARASLAAGHRYFRLGLPVRQPPDGFDSRWAVRRLVEQLRAVRAAVGDGLELMVDLHTRLLPDEAVWFCRQVEPLGMFAVEDPIRAENLHGYHRIRRQTSVPIAAGEQWCSKWEFREAIEHELIDFARVDICIAGGISETRKIAAMCETHNVRLLLHNPLGPICTAASLHIDLSSDVAGPQEVIFPPHLCLPDVFGCGFDIRDMHLTPPERPGIGVTFDIQAASLYPPDMTEPPHYRRPDGGFTNY